MYKVIHSPFPWPLELYFMVITMIITDPTKLHQLDVVVLLILSICWLSD